MIYSCDNYNVAFFSHHENPASQTELHTLVTIIVLGFPPFCFGGSVQILSTRWRFPVGGSANSCSFLNI